MCEVIGAIEGKVLPDDTMVRARGKSGYDTCSGCNSLSNDDSGTTTVTLMTAGVHYFSCDIPGHCANGMKLTVTITVARGLDDGRHRPCRHRRGVPRAGDERRRRRRGGGSDHARTVLMKPIDVASFWPDRWIGGDGAPQHIVVQGGAAIYLGKHTVYLQMKMALAILCRF